MKTKYYFISVLFFLLIASVNSQTKYSVSVYGGYTIPAADLKGEFPDTLGTTLLNFNRSGTLLSKSGFNIGVSGKYCVDTLGKAKLTAGFNNNSFSGSKEYKRTAGTLTYDNKVNIFTISAGFEYNLMPQKKISPFAGLEFAVNFFSGKITASGDSVFVIQRKSETRFGVIANAGLELKLNQTIGAVIGIKYGLTNLIGKKTDITAVTNTAITDDEQGNTSSLKEIGLNDEETSSNRAKSLNYIQIYAGFSYRFGDLLK